MAGVCLKHAADFQSDFYGLFMVLLKSTSVLTIGKWGIGSEFVPLALSVVSKGRQLQKNGWNSFITYFFFKSTGKSRENEKESKALSLLLN